MIRGFFFDLDGTLVDTHRANYEAYKLALADYNVAIDFEVFKTTIGMQANNFLPIIAPSLSEDSYGDIAVKKTQYYKNLVHLSTLNTTLFEFIKSVNEHYKTALVTTARKANAEAILQHHDLDKYFDITVTVEDVAVSKPHPDAYLLALQKLNLQASEVITFEDSKVGIDAAKSAGIAVIEIQEFAL